MFAEFLMPAHRHQLGSSATYPIEQRYSTLAALLVRVGISPLRRCALHAHCIAAHSGTSNGRI